MKILFLTNIPVPYRVDFFNELGKKCDLTVLYERNNATDREASWLKRKVESFTEVFLNGINVGNDSALCFEVLSWLRKRNFDLIIIGGYSTPTGMLAIEYLKLKKIPFILNSDGGFEKDESKFKYYLKRHFISKANAWLSTAKCTDDYLVKYGAKRDRIFRYPFTSIRNVDILKNPINKEEKLEIKRKLNITESKTVITVGQFIYRKGFDILIRACSKMPENLGIYIIGGEPTDEFINLKKELNLTNVHFVGFKQKDELSQYYKAADLFVLPTREDIWGLVINEALAHGLPIVTTNKCIAGLELVEDNVNGFIVKVDDVDELANKMLKIISNDQLCTEMSNNGLDKITNYTIENMASYHLNIINDLIKNT